MNIVFLENLKTQTEELSKKVELLIFQISDKDKSIYNLKKRNLALEEQLKNSKKSESISLKDNDPIKNLKENKEIKSKFEEYIKIINKCILYLEN